MFDLHRAWLWTRTRVKQQTASSRSFILLLMQGRKQMPFNVLAVSRGKLAIANFKLDLPMNRWLYVCLLLVELLGLTLSTIRLSSRTSSHFQERVTLPTTNLLSSCVADNCGNRFMDSFPSYFWISLMLSSTGGNSPECVAILLFFPIHILASEHLPSPLCFLIS